MRLLKFGLWLLSFPLVVAAVLTVGALTYSFRRKNEEEELLLEANEAALAKPHEVDGEHDDKERLWFRDMTPFERCRDMGRILARNAAEVEPAEDFQTWYRRRHPHSQYVQ